MVVLLAAIALGGFVAQQLWPWIATRLTVGSRDGADAVRVSPPVQRPISPNPSPPLEPQAGTLATHGVGSQTSGTLLLIDTTVGVSFHDGTARLGLDVHDSQTYMAGAILLNGARLTEVHSDYVVLERDRQTARLYVQGKEPAQISASSPLFQLTATTLKPSVPTAPPAVDSEATSTLTLTDFVRPNPVFDQGQLRGFQLNPGRQSAAFWRLGLLSGDVLTRIDGEPATDADQVVSALEQVLSGATLDATVERGGHPQQVTLDGASIVSGNQ